MQNLTFEYAGKIYAAFSLEAALAAGVPQAVIDQAVAAERRELVKIECRQRIYGIASAEAQINVTAISAIIGAKAASARSAEETALIATAQDSLDWVMAMRARFAALAADPVADFLADASWPACPADVVSLYQQF